MTEQFTQAPPVLNNNTVDSLNLGATTYFETYPRGNYHWYYPCGHYHQVITVEDERMRFALELIAQGDLTKDQLIAIAKKALK